MIEWENIPDNVEDYEGFVYYVHEIDTNMCYIGIKRFWKTVKLKPLKGKKNKRHRRRETDWRTYNTSSTIMHEKLEKNPDNYRKVIYKCLHSITDMKCLEAYLQLKHHHNGLWDKLYNEVINLRLRIRKGGNNE